MITITRDERIDRLEKVVANLKRHVATLLPNENLSDYKNIPNIRASFKKARKLYPTND